MKIGCASIKMLPNWDHTGDSLRIVGKDIVETYIARAPHSWGAEVARAWLAEIRHREWPDAMAMKADFIHSDISMPPFVRFDLKSAVIRIETIVDFRTGVVLVQEIIGLRPRANASSQTSLT